MEFHSLTEKKLIVAIAKKTEEVADLRFDIKSGDTSKLKDYREAKKELAQLKTVLKEKQNDGKKEK